MYKVGDPWTSSYKKRGGVLMDTYKESLSVFRATC